MAANNADFTQGSGQGKGLGYNPVNVPANRVDDSGVMKPTAELASQIKSAESLISTPGATKKKLVGMNDTLGIVKSLHTALSAAHSKLVSQGVRHEGLASARASLHGDSSVTPDHSAFMGVADHLTLAHTLKADQTPLAWQHIQAAGQKLHAAYNALSNVAPHLKDLSIPHSVNGVALNITPGQELLHITSAPTQFKARGKAPNSINIGGKVIKAEDVKRGLDRSAALPEFSVREDLRQKVQQRMKGTPRFRKVQGQQMTPNPKTDVTRVEPLGSAATDVNRTGDWSGAETARNMPESVIPKVDRQRNKRGGK